MVNLPKIAELWRLNRTFPVVIALLLIATLGVLAVNRSILTPRLNSLEESYRQRQSGVRQEQKEAKTQNTPEAIFLAGVRDLEEFRELIPEKVRFTELISEIFGLGESAGLVIDRITYQPEDLEKHGIQRYTLQFSVTGTYGQIKKYIYSLEQSKRLVVIEDMALSGAPEKPEEKSTVEKITLRLRLSTPFQATSS